MIQPVNRAFEGKHPCSSCGKNPAIFVARYREGTKFLCSDCAVPPRKPLQPLRSNKKRRRK